jgi:hypothetical protein
MVNIDNVMTAIGDLVDKAKDMEVEKIATVGLVTVAVIGTAVKAVSKQSAEIIENVTNSK